MPVWGGVGLLLLGLTTAGLQAAVKTWNGASSTSAKWTDGGNWTDGLGVVANDSLIFTGNVQTSNTNDQGSAKQISGITFDSGAASFSLYSASSAGTVTLTGNGVTNNSPNLQTLYNPFRVGNGASSGWAFLNAAAGDLTFETGSSFASTTSGSAQGWLVVLGSHGVNISGTVNVSGGITNRGPGTLTLSGVNGYSSNTVLVGGTLKLGASEVIPDGAGKGNVVFNPASDTATLDVAGQSETINGLSSSGAGASIVENSTGNGTLTVGANNTSSSFSGTIKNTSGSLALVKIGSGTLTLGGANTYSGATTINGGTLIVGASGSLGSASSVSIAAGATLDVSAKASYSWDAGAGLSASGTGTGVGTSAASINCTTVDLGTCPVTLNFTPTTFIGDGTHPALYIASGSLTLNGAITVINNGAEPLQPGNYKLITQASGSITGSPTLSGVGGMGLADSAAAHLSNTGTEIVLVVTSTGNVSTTTTLARHAGTGSASTYGDALSFDISISPSAATGTITLQDDDGTVLGTGALVSGSCTISPDVTVLKAGPHTNLLATYGGGGSYLPSTSVALSPAQVVARKGLVVADAMVNSRYYDGTTTAIINATLVGVLSGDTVTYGTGTFASPGPGTSIVVTASPTLGGASAANYTLSALPTGLTADIYAAGVWIGSVDARWSTVGNWANNLVPAGSDITADFSTLDLFSDTTVNLDAPQTIGNLVFGDTDINSPAGWTLANNGAATNVLTLAGTAPTITVNVLGDSKSATISAVVAGFSGLTKQGDGTLVLSAVNSYSGPTTIGAGMLAVGGAGQLGGGAYAAPITNNSTLAYRSSAAQTWSGVISGGGALACSGSGTLTLAGVNTYSGGTALTAGVLTVATNSALGTGPLTLDSGAVRLSVNDGVTVTNAITINAAAPGTGNAAINGAGAGVATINGPVAINGGISHFGNNSGGTIAVNGPITGSVPVQLRKGTMVLSGGGSYTSLLLNQDSLVLGADNGLCPQAVLFVTSTAGRSGTVYLNGFDQELAGLQGPGSNSKATVTSTNAALSTLTLNTITDSSFGGSITGNVALIKSGAATQTLSNTNTYTGNTTISNGTLALAADGSISGSPVITVSSDATLDVSAVSGGYTLGAEQTLGGLGTISGSVLANGTVALGTSRGTLTFNNNLTLAGTSAMKISKDGGLASDLLSVAGTLTYGGTLQVMVTGNTPLAVNDTFKLFSFTTPPAMPFAAFALPAGYSWDTDRLTVDGTIKVTGVNVVAPPAPPTISQVALSGTNLVLIWKGGTNQSCPLLSTTNVALPRSSWTATATNVVGLDGLSTNIIPVNPAEPKRFFLLSVPNN